MSGKNLIIQGIENAQLKTELPEFGAGDTVTVQVKVKEGTRERLQAFQGVVIARRNRGLNSAFTVRKISHGVGVERVFQLHSPLIDSIEVNRRGDVSRCTTCATALASLPGSKKKSGKTPRLSSVASERRFSLCCRACEIDLWPDRMLHTKKSLPKGCGFFVCCTGSLLIIA